MESLQAMAQRLHTIYEADGLPACQVALDEIKRLHGREVAIAALKEVLRRNKEAKAERAKESRGSGERRRPRSANARLARK